MSNLEINADEFDLAIGFRQDGFVYLTIPHESSVAGLDLLRLCDLVRDELACRGWLCLDCARDGLRAVLEQPEARIVIHGHGLTPMNTEWRAKILRLLDTLPDEDAPPEQLRLFN
jgi:hypothetical protein